MTTRYVTGRLSPEEVSERRALLAPHDGTNEKVWAALFATIGCWSRFPSSYLDLGSGTGAMVNLARRMGIEAYGVDLIAESPGHEDWFIVHDLGQPLRLLKDNDNPWVRFSVKERFEPITEPGIRQATFDLVTCLEVAEHIPSRSALTLCQTISLHMEEGGLLVFSAAPPGQEGEDHVNCQPATYWRSLFAGVGVSYRADYTAQLSHLWGWVAGPLSWLAANVQVFDK